METPEATMREAANRLHHLSMRYSGAMVELVSKEKVGFLLKDHPGLKEVRDFIDLILLTRAEINGLSKLLLEAGVVKAEDLQKTFAEEYEWLTNVKAKQLGVGVTDAGLVFTKEPPT